MPQRSRAHDFIYQYDPSGKRLWEGAACCAGSRSAKVNFYGITEQKLTTFQVSRGASPGVSVLSRNVYFGGKLVRAGGVTVATDRRGSVRGKSGLRRTKRVAGPPLKRLAAVGFPIPGCATDVQRKTVS